MKIRREITALNFVHQGEAGKIIGLWEEKKKKKGNLCILRQESHIFLFDKAVTFSISLSYL